MANKYNITKLDSFSFETDGQTYEVSAEVDSLEYITLQFGESFSLRFNYDSAENLENILKTARHVIQDQIIDTAGKNLKNSSGQVKEWDPNNPSNW